VISKTWKLGLPPAQSQMWEYEFYYEEQEVISN